MNKLRGGDNLDILRKFVRDETVTASISTRRFIRGRNYKQIYDNIEYIIWYNSTIMTDIQYISDAKGNPVGVFVPIEVWREIEPENETAYLTKSETMKQRLLEAKERGEKTGDNFWLAASEDSLRQIWNNEEDDVYAELLEK